MPLFDWKAPTIAGATTEHFWFYWAITGPLTVTTMIIVLSWEEKRLGSGRERFVDLLRKRRVRRRGFLAREMELRGFGVWGAGLGWWYGWELEDRELPKKKITSRGVNIACKWPMFTAGQVWVSRVEWKFQVPSTTPKLEHRNKPATIFKNPPPSFPGLIFVRERSIEIHRPLPCSSAWCSCLGRSLILN